MKKGFTLIELIITIALLGLIGTIIATNMTGILDSEQEKEYNNLNCYELGCFPHTKEALDYLTKNHFDYRYLIEKGLAIDATGLNIY